MFVSCTRPIVRKCCKSNFFFAWIATNFFGGGVTGNRDRKFQYHSRIYVRNWFTLLNEQNPLLDFEGTRFVNELWKKNPPTYRPIDEMEGRVRETNIFLRVTLLILFLSILDFDCFALKSVKLILHQNVSSLPLFLLKCCHV